MKYTSIAFIVSFAFSQVAFSEQWLCVVDHATGFSYDKETKKWGETSFTTDQKYLISEATMEKEYHWLITQIGDKSPHYLCEKDFDGGGNLECSAVFGEFKFNKKNGRFLNAGLIGYYGFPGSELSTEIIDEVGDTPALEIGKCSPFET